MRPPIDRPRNASMPWLPVLIVVGALVMAGVLIVVLARLVALPAGPSSVAPGPAPLSHSRKPPVETSETEEWSGRPGPAYAR